MRQLYQSVLWQVVLARGADAELALKVWCQWEFESLIADATEVMECLAADRMPWSTEIH